MTTLTEKKIRDLKPDADEYVVADGARRGLYLVVAPSGRKFFRARLQVEGKTKKQSFKPDWPELSLEAARDAFDDHKKDRRRGATSHAIEGRRVTVAELLDEWDRLYLQSHRTTPEAARHAIAKDALPVIGKTLVSAVTRRDLVAVIDRVTARGSVRMAGVLTSLLKQMFDFAVKRGLIEDSPARLLEAGESGKRRKRALTDEELRRFWWATATDRDQVPEKYRDAYLPRVTPYTKRALRLLLLTGMRRSQVVEAAWSEVDEAEALWTIPVERTKTPLAERDDDDAEPHVVPLSDLALEVLAEQRALTKDCAYVFASPEAEPPFSRPMYASAVTQAIRDNFHVIVGVEGRRRGESAADYDKRTARVSFVPHDLRRSVRSRMASIGVGYATARRVVGHVLDGMDEVYDRHDYLDAKREALQRWADELRRILAGAERKVVPLRVAAV